MKTSLIIPDVHIPFHDRRAYELTLVVAATISVDEVVLLGDYADFYGVSSYAKDPGIGIRLDQEVREVNKHLDELQDLLPNADIVYIEGNHESRLTRYIQGKCPELYGVADVPKLLNLKERGIKWIPYGPGQMYKVAGSHLIARHEPMGGGEYPAGSTVKKAGASVIFGHTHRIQEFQTVTIDGCNYRGINAGCLVDVSSPVMQYVQSHHQWALGFNIVHSLSDRTFFANSVHIIDYKCVVNGELFCG